MRQQAELLLLTGRDKAAAGAFPMYLFTEAGAYLFDVSNPENREVYNGSTFPVYGGPIGKVQPQISSGSMQSMEQRTAANRPIFRRVLDRDAMEFDGVSGSMTCALAGLEPDFVTPPDALTLFISIYLHTTVSGQTGFSFDNSSRPNANSRHLLTTSASGCRCGCRLDAAQFASNVVWENPAASGVWMDLFWELDIQSIKVAGVGTGVGTIRSWLNEEPMLETAIVPDRGSLSAGGKFTHLSLASSRNGSTQQEWCACTIGRSGYARRALTADERGLIKDWLRAPAYVPPTLVAP